MKYWDRVKVTSWFYEGMEGTVIDYMRWTTGWIEKPYDLKEWEWHNEFWSALSKNQKAYKILDEKRNIILRYREDSDYIPESSLELIK